MKCSLKNVVLVASQHSPSGLSHPVEILDGAVEVIPGNLVDDVTSQERPRRFTPQFTSVFVIHIQELYRTDSNQCQTRDSITQVLMTATDVNFDSASVHSVRKSTTPESG